MAPEVTDDMRDPNTPDSVEIRATPRPPMLDPTAGVPLELAPVTPTTHRLVALGDSLTHGFQSGAIYRTDLSFPAIIAHELGWGRQFRFPRYGGPGGLPLNIEFILRKLEHRYGDRINWWEFGGAALTLRSIMDDVEDYWETGAGSLAPVVAGINHNLGMYGWDLRDALSRTNALCAAAIDQPSDNWFAQVVENASDRAALRVLPSKACHPRPMSTVDAAQALGNDGDGIETLIVFLGANNALGTVVNLSVKWSGADYSDLEKKQSYTVWRPEHFADELAALEKRVANIKAARVIWATVPHVTVAPIARGVGSKVRADSRYFPYYTRPWIDDAQFTPARDPHITGAQARAIDCAIDQYNDAIVDTVRRGRTGGLPWFVLDTAGVLDRLAYRRYVETPDAQPEWWTPYELPQELAALQPRPDSRFFRSGPSGRSEGGLFSLDGVHPTTIAYGILAQEFIRVMQVAGVPFFGTDGVTPRPGRVRVDFGRLVEADTLISDPPRSLANDLRLIGWMDQKVDCLTRWLGR